MNENKNNIGHKENRFIFVFLNLVRYRPLVDILSYVV